MKEIVEACEDQGFIVNYRKSGHPTVSQPDGTWITDLAKTASDYRGRRNALAVLKRAGLVWPPPKKNKKNKNQMSVIVMEPPAVAAPSQPPTSEDLQIAIHTQQELAMTEWSVRLVVHTSAKPPTDDQIEHISESLSTFQAALGPSEHGSLEAQMAIGANTLLEAINAAGCAVREAAAAVGIRDMQVTEVEAMTWEEFDRRLDLPHVPELWSVHQAAEHLGVTNQRVNQLAQRYPEALPSVVKLSGDRGPRLWLADTWRRFAKTERHIGRPRSAKNTAAKNEAVSV